MGTFSSPCFPYRLSTIDAPLPALSNFPRRLDRDDFFARILGMVGSYRSAMGETAMDGVSIALPAFRHWDTRVAAFGPNSPVIQIASGGLRRSCSETRDHRPLLNEWLRSGERNTQELKAGGGWRPKIRFRMNGKPLVSQKLPRHVREALAELRTALTAIYGARVQAVYLYGSYARGDFHQDSDVDVLVLLSGEVQLGAEVARHSMVVSQICLRHDLLIAIMTVSEESFKREGGPFFANVRREAVRL